MWTPWVVDDILGTQGLVSTRQGVVGGSTERLSHIAIGLGLSGQDLTSSFSQKLGEVVFGRCLERSQEEEETAVEKWRELKG